MNEVALTALLCGFLSGSATEAVHEFQSNGSSRRIRVDCETQTHVIEVGIDTSRGSRDSLHQALFSAALTGKRPAIVIIDTDGLEGRFEQEIRIVAREAGVAFGVCSKAAILRWSATAPWRGVLDKSLDDLPSYVAMNSVCRLDVVLRPAE